MPRFVKGETEAHPAGRLTGTSESVIVTGVLPRWLSQNVRAFGRCQVLR